MAIRILMKPHIVILLVVCFVTRAALDSKLVNVMCSQHCHCYKDTNHRISAKCDLNDLNSSYLADISLPQDLFSLDLSSSGLKEIPVSFLRKLSNISSLILANNSLENMKENSFSELKQLRTLDLSFSKMRYLGKELPRLQNLFVKQSRLAYLWSWPGWHDILTLQSIKFVRDVTWASSCVQCNITKTRNSNVTLDLCRANCSKTKMYYSKGRTVEESSGEICWLDNVVSPWYAWFRSPFWYLRPGFTLQCLCDPRDCTTHPPLNSLELLPRLVQRLLNCLYPLASVGLLLNSVVISLVSTSKDLRKSPTMFLILNMAVCDLFMGLWCVLTATFNAYPDSDEEVEALSYHGKIPDRISFFLMCPYLTFIFGVTQMTTVMTSLFVTVERYLVIVYSMKPEVRMTKKISAICVCITWFMAVAYNIYAVFLLSGDQRWRNSYVNSFLCTASGYQIRVTGWVLGIPLSTFNGGFCILIFLCTIPLYIHMYIVVRKSSTQMGIKREGTLARKLALLVLTNLLFSTIPLSFAPFFSNFNLLLPRQLVYKTYSSYKVGVICSVWVPVLLLSLNSCLNPVLFAFKHHLFKRHFRKTFQTILQYFIKEQVAPTHQQVNEQCGRNTVKVRETSL